jgi:hypothetical protein
VRHTPNIAPVLPNAPYSEAWRCRIRKVLQKWGNNADLAKWLCGHCGGKFESRRVQISRIFGKDSQQVPSAEFLLAVEHWLSVLPQAQIPWEGKKASLKPVDFGGIWGNVPKPITKGA